MMSCVTQIYGKDKGCKNLLVDADNTYLTDFTSIHASRNP